ncbi:hypothetical protein [Conexibacter arvalis]|uniref:Uncharacterized protein n=1 Tax=Conexibacter arvalis TaxID=912552 RepID=A0A840IBA3_9ACTN|nr:hypothetical protein [Conexibacter arvalis]MBB4661384.1 hypothetical protein [Conexibacter arvalis]
MRTIRSGILGRGIVGLAVRTGQNRWRTVPLGEDGAYILAQRGLFTARSIPPLRVTATLCGPNARHDLLGLYQAARRGCTVTYELPNGPRPARESPASRRARRAARLDVPVRVERDPRAAASVAYRIAFRIPITIATALEFYTWRITGPSAPACKRTRSAASTYQSYLWTAGRTVRLPLWPPNSRSDWCPGRYTVTVAFTQAYATRAHGRRKSVVRTRSKKIGTAHFTVPRH